MNIVGGYAYVASKNRNGPNGSNSNDDGSGNSLTILDIATNPAQPTVVGSVRDPINLFGAYGVAVSGNYAYVAAQGCLSGKPCPNPNVGDSFAVVDISNPANPTIVCDPQQLESPLAVDRNGRAEARLLGLRVRQLRVRDRRRLEPAHRDRHLDADEPSDRRLQAGREQARPRSTSRSPGATRTLPTRDRARGG